VKVQGPRGLVEAVVEVFESSFAVRTSRFLKNNDDGVQVFLAVFGRRG